MMELGHIIEEQRRIQEFGMGEAGFPSPDLPSPLLLPLISRPLNPESGRSPPGSGAEPQPKSN